MNIFIYDGTAEGFFTAVFDAYREKESYITDREIQLQLGDTSVSVLTNSEKAERVIKKLSEKDPIEVNRIKTALRSNLPDKAQRVYVYLRLIIKYGRSAKERQSDQAVLNFYDAFKKVNNEVGRMLGFLHFTECADGILYAPCSPDNDIIDLILPHFIDRLRGQKFVIHDTTRKKAALYNGKAFILIPLEKTEIILSEGENNFVSLWKEYYNSVSIKSRKNIGQMKRSMPVRYWKFMVEKN